MRMNRSYRFALIGLSVLLLIAAVTATGVFTAEAQQGQPKVHFWLTLLHNNDGESQLIDAGGGLEDFGGVARFATLVEQLKAEATEGAPRSHRSQTIERGVLMVSSGDNFLAGPEFNASLEIRSSFLRYHCDGPDRLRCHRHRQSRV